MKLNKHLSRHHTIFVLRIETDHTHYAKQLSKLQLHKITLSFMPH